MYKSAALYEFCCAATFITHYALRITHSKQKASAPKKIGAEARGAVPLWFITLATSY